LVLSLATQTQKKCGL
jgi:PadR family transcriptional regulator, regulatory protein PadR